MTEMRTEQSAAVLFLHAQTSLHPGSGTALGVVDLPVQRERHTQWPIIPGSALKGILRDRCRERAKSAPDYGGDRKKANKDASLVAAFGPEGGDSSAHAGALSITDARLLAFPVRSLKGVFAWVTCAAVLGRMVRDFRLAGVAGPDVPEVREQGSALCAASSDLLIDGKQLVLEEFDFTNNGDCTALADSLASRAVGDDFTAARLKTHLVVLHDDDFTHFARHATEVTARIGLNYETKTVKKGALFYQEFIPPESLFYALVFANPARNGPAKTAPEILRYLRENVPNGSVLQIGGDETTGKGLCNVRFASGGT